MTETRPAGGPGGSAEARRPVPPPAGRDHIVNKVVVARTDGRRARGFVYDINAENPDFHLFATEDPSESEAELIRVADCKALYFVKSLTGNPDYDENKTELPPGRRLGRPYEVVFGDGERIVGWVEVYHEERLGFYLVPPDPKSNNFRIFVVKANAREVRPLDAGPGAGAGGEWVAPDPARYPADKRIEVVLRHLRGKSLEDLSGDVHLPVPILAHWKERFLAAGRDALTDAALSRPLPGEEPGAPAKPDRTPREKRLEAVLHLVSREDEAVVSQIFLAPVRVLVGWRERFLEAGDRALREQAAAEDNENPEAVRARYEALLRPPEKEDGLKALLDRFSEVIRKDPKEGRPR